MLNKIVQKKALNVSLTREKSVLARKFHGSLYEYAKASDAQIWVKLTIGWRRKLEPKQLVTLILPPFLKI